MRSPSLWDSNHWKVLFRCTVPGTPPSTNTLYPRGTFNGRRFLSNKGREYKKQVEEISRKRFPHEPYTGTLKYFIRLYFGDRRRRDNANYEKCLIDSLQGIVFEDDTQFKVTKIEKHYDPESPRVEVDISAYEPTPEEVRKSLRRIKADLGLLQSKQFESPCLRCPLLFYWAIENISPTKDQKTHCTRHMRLNSEFSCKKRPREKYTDDIIQEGLIKWL